MVRLQAVFVWLALGGFLTAPFIPASCAHRPTHCCTSQTVVPTTSTQNAQEPRSQALSAAPTKSACCCAPAQPVGKPCACCAGKVAKRVPTHNLVQVDQATTANPKAAVVGPTVSWSIPLFVGCTCCCQPAEEPISTPVQPIVWRLHLPAVALLTEDLLGLMASTSQPSSIFKASIRAVHPPYHKLFCCYRE